MTRTRPILDTQTSATISIMWQVLQVQLLGSKKGKNPLMGSPVLFGDELISIIQEPLMIRELIKWPIHAKETRDQNQQDNNFKWTTFNQLVSLFFGKLIMSTILVIVTVDNAQMNGGVVLASNNLDPYWYLADLAYNYHNLLDRSKEFNIHGTTRLKKKKNWSKHWMKRKDSCRLDLQIRYKRFQIMQGNKKKIVD